MEMVCLISPDKQIIRAARLAAGLTQSQAAALVHCKLRAWQQWEAGDRAMHPAFWELWCIKKELLGKKMIDGEK